MAALSEIIIYSDTKADTKAYLTNLAKKHPCFHHPLFSRLSEVHLTTNQIALLLRNYDAHASVLRRLLLQAATIMPEEAVGYILENVRNEYGNGDPDQRHQLQLIDVALKSGVTREEFDTAAIQLGVQEFIDKVIVLYYPDEGSFPDHLLPPAIASGAITGTELLALREFEYLQKTFAKHNLSQHIWFDHVNVEAEHSDESLMLALHFIEQYDAASAVEYGMTKLLDANLHLYDGLLSAIAE